MAPDFPLPGALFCFLNLQVRVIQVMVSARQDPQHSVCSWQAETLELKEVTWQDNVHFVAAIHRDYS